MFYRTPIQGFLANNEINTNSTNNSTSNTSSIVQKPPLPVRVSSHMSQSNVIDYQTSNSK
jgi:hypothetical protein